MNEIKVGSEWVNEGGRRFNVLFVGEFSALAQWDNKKEFNPLLVEFGSRYKPAPVRRTVWLNVYEDEVQCYNSKNKADNNIGYGLLYQQEVELIDPRERGTKP